MFIDNRGCHPVTMKSRAAGFCNPVLYLCARLHFSYIDDIYKDAYHLKFLDFMGKNFYSGSKVSY